MLLHCERYKNVSRMETSFIKKPRLFDRFLSLIESSKPSDRWLLRFSVAAVVITGILFALSVNDQYSAIVPIKGGTIAEGIIGTPRFVNPALAITRADQDITALVYRGMMKISNDGIIIPDLAESVTISEDGATYNIVLRKDMRFHDNTPVTARDVIFTIQLIQNPDLKSPLRGNWSDVVVEEISEYELNIVLEEAYAPFIENFTLGIMPAHLWSALPIEQLPFSQLNTEPIGAGPFQIESARRDASGLISNYTLTAFTGNHDTARIDSIRLEFYQNEEALIDALERKEIGATAYLSSDAIAPLLKSIPLSLTSEPLPRVFGIFFNQNRSASLRDESAREALTVAIDRDVIIDSALSGYGVPISFPTILSENTIELEDGTNGSSSSPTDRAIAILKDGGWLQNNLGLWEKQIDGSTETLSVTLRTSNISLFSEVTDSIAAQWKAVGVEVVVEQFEQAGLVQSVIRPRDFQALLFGIDMSRSYDLYPFWHSSQKDDPGLNIAQYTNLSVDQLLETARTEQDPALRNATLIEASATIAEEFPAIFLFQPYLTYVTDPRLTIPPTAQIEKPADRFNNIVEWHIETDTLWPVFREEV